MATTLNHLCQTHIDPKNLRGLKQAEFIAEHLCNGIKEEQIVRLFHGDKQLVDIWVSFLMHNHWIEHNEAAKEWIMTAKGKEKTTGIVLAQ